MGKRDIHFLAGTAAAIESVAWRSATHDEERAWLSGWATFDAEETEHGLLIYDERGREQVERNGR